MLQSLLTEIDRPLPPLPSHPLTSHGQRLSPWLVNIARARKVLITKVFAFLYQKRTVWMFSLPDFAVNLRFSRCSPFVFNTLDVSQEGVPPCVMADLGKCRESLENPWNASYVLANGFKTTFGIVCKDSGWIRKGAKSADFEQNAWAIAHDFKDVGFG